jgi:predicted DCC family thiol-disulfide oxidoreductase YuxK
LFAFTLRGADWSTTSTAIRSLGWSALWILVPQLVWTAVHAEAWRQILLELDAWRWRVRIAGLPGIRRLGAAIYSVIAANRHRIPVGRG